MGERRIAESAEEMQVSSKDEPGDEDVRISGSAREERPSSGKARIADRRLRIKVLRVGRSREYTNDEFVAFHREVGPLLPHS